MQHRFLVPIAAAAFVIVAWVVSAVIVGFIAYFAASFFNLGYDIGAWLVSMIWIKP